MCKIIHYLAKEGVHLISRNSSHDSLILKISFLLLEKKLDYFHYYLSVTSLRQTWANLIFNFLGLLAAVGISRTCLEEVVLSNGGVSISQHLALLFAEKTTFIAGVQCILQGFVGFFSSPALHFPCWEVFLLLFYHWKVNVILKCPLSQPRFSRGAYSFP